MKENYFFKEDSVISNNDVVHSNKNNLRSTERDEKESFNIYY